MTELDAIFPAVAAEMLAQFGVSCSHLRQERVYDELRGEETTRETVYAIKLVPFALVKTLTDSAATAGQSVTYGAATDFAVSPSVGDYLLSGGVRHLINALEPIKSGDLVALYKITVSVP